MKLNVNKVAFALASLALVAVLAWKLSNGSTPRAVEPPRVHAPGAESGARHALPALPSKAAPADIPGETVGVKPRVLVSERPNVTGIVQSALGQPLDAAAVRIGEGAAARIIAHSDRDGHFRVSGLSPGEILLTAGHPDYIPSTVRVTVLPNRVSEVAIVLASGGSVGGTVFQGTQPLPGASVMVSGTSALPKTARSDDAGRYRINGLLPGEVQVECQVRVEGLQVPLSRQRLAYVEENGLTTVDIDFPDQTGSIGGLVTVNGRPATGGIVQAYSAGKRGESFASAPIGKSGEYLLEFTAPGELWLDVVAESDTGVKLTRQFSLTLSGNERVERNIELGGSSVIEGEIENPASGKTYQVLLFSGEINAAALRSTPEPTVASLTADADGHFRIDGIDGGVYTVLVMAVDSGAEQSPEAYVRTTTVSRTLTVKDGETAVLGVPGR